MKKNIDKKNLAISLTKSGIKEKKQGHVEQSMRLFLEAIKLDPSFSSAYWHLGNCLIDQDNYSKALIFLKKAISLNPKVDHYYFWLALTYNLLGNYLNK